MSLEAIGAAAAKEVIAGKAAIESARQIAEKMGVQSVNEGLMDRQAFLSEQTNQIENFRIGEMQNPEINQKDFLKQKEVEAADELREKLLEENIDVSQEKDFTETLEVKECKKEYVEDVISRSEVPETLDQEKLLENEYRRITPEENATMRTEFAQSRMELRKEWEHITGQDWPRYKEDVYLPGKDTPYRRAGDAYDAHHIQPLGLGGKNVASNITPIHALDHADKMGIHAFGSPYDKLEKITGAV